MCQFWPVHASQAPLEYLLSLQLAIAWSDTSAYEWGDGDDGVVGGVDLSVRPSKGQQHVNPRLPSLLVDVG